jgi:hypothetical protein
MDFIGMEYAKIPRVRRTNFLLTMVVALDAAKRGFGSGKHEIVTAPERNWRIVFGNKIRRTGDF